MEICKKISMSLCSLLAWILRYGRILVLALCMAPLISVTITMGGRPSFCISFVCKMSYFCSLLMMVAWGNLLL